MDLEDNEYEMLKCCLKEISAYEEGLDLSDMREIYKAFWNSLENSDYTTNNMTFDAKDQNDFSKICNSTMIIDDSEQEINTSIIESGFQSSLKNISSISSVENLESPEIQSQKIVVVADVHHELSFNPNISSTTFNSNDFERKFNQTDNCPYSDQTGKIHTNNHKISIEKKINKINKANDSGMEISPINSCDDIEKF